MNEELLSCPFCGTAVTLTIEYLDTRFCRYQYGFYGKIRYSIACKNCGATNKNCSHSTLTLSDDEARRLTIDGWNKRS